MQARLSQQLREKQAILETSINKQQKELRALHTQLENYQGRSSDPIFTAHVQLIQKLEVCGYNHADYKLKGLSCQMLSLCAYFK